MKRILSNTPSLAETPSKNKLTARAILAITIPLACALASMSWAISAYLMEREKQQTQRELGHLK